MQQMAAEERGRFLTLHRRHPNGVDVRDKKPHRFDVRVVEVTAVGGRRRYGAVLAQTQVSDVDPVKGVESAIRLQSAYARGRRVRSGEAAALVVRVDESGGAV